MLFGLGKACELEFSNLGSFVSNLKTKRFALGSTQSLRHCTNNLLNGNGLELKNNY